MDPISETRGRPIWPWAMMALGLLVVVVVAIVLANRDSGGTGEIAFEAPSSVAGSEPDSPTPTTEREPTSVPQPLPDRAAIIEESLAMVEKLRGLPFLHEVDMEFLSAEDFGERVRSRVETEIDPDELERAERVWQALGLIEPEVSLAEVVVEAFGEGVLGYYDPEVDTLVMRGVEVTPFVQSTLIHELTHALDDQHFDLDRPELEDGDDSEAQFGFTGLVEGSASWVEDRWVASLDAERTRQLREEEARFAASMDVAGIPEALLIDISLPYTFGPELVDALFDEGGTEAVDAAFLDPPRSGEQVLFPQDYLAGDEPVVVATPPADGPVVDEGVIGSSGLLLVVASHAPQELPDLLDHWGGDRYVAWEAADGTSCVRSAFRADSDRGLERFASALAAVAAALDDADTARHDDTVTLTSCG